jgi:AraC-like DNA-binding protein
MPRVIEHSCHSSELGRWESAVALPHPALRAYVREYVGGSEATPQPLVRRELPTEIAPVIINFGAPFRMIDRLQPSAAIEVRSFATGAFDTYVLVGSTGSYSCLQINFTILGARLFLRQPLNTLTNLVVPLDAMLGTVARELEARLYDATDWGARFDILDRFILSRVIASPGVPEAVVNAWQRLVVTRGQTRIASLAASAGWSHKHFIAQFSEHIGLTPKAMARVLRFGRAAEMLRVSERGHFADIAHSCGYFDQAHFTRDFRAFAGVNPTELLSSQLPHRGGFVA